MAILSYIGCVGHNDIKQNNSLSRFVVLHDIVYGIDCFFINLMAIAKEKKAHI